MSEGQIRSSRGPLLLWALLLCLGGGGILFWGLMGVLRGPSLQGDGTNPETYGFDLSNLTIESDALQASGNPRDFLVVYESPGIAAGSEVAALNASHSRSWQKDVVSSDRVIGVHINGEYRAYPLFIMNAHEIVLDELGGVPIAVTYSPLLDAVNVFDRRIEDESLQFGVSGLLAECNLLFYDQGEDPSLFRQLDGTAVSGPRAGTTLARIPGVAIDRWKTWLGAHPETTVILRDPQSLGRYKRISYERYFDGDRWIIPPLGEIPEGAKDRVLAVRPLGQETWTILDLRELKESAQDSGIVEREIGGKVLRLRFDTEENRVDTVHVIDGIEFELVPALRIAWQGSGK